MSEAEKSHINTEVGHVVSNKMNKTVVVSIVRQVRHQKYGKILKSKSKRFAHDEKNECREGDLVLIKECRPISKNKSWEVIKVIESAPV